MAVLTFRTPSGMYCHWDSPACIAYDSEKFVCKFYQEFLHYDGDSNLKCEQCMKLGTYGTDKTL